MASWRYDVFPSFSGEDVRKSFLSHLLRELDRKLINTFIDHGIERSRPIAPELLSAIRESRISIVVFSKNYASSTWCLNELVQIHKCFHELDQMVIPVFYEVDPSHVRKQTGEFGEAFLKTCKGKTDDEKRRWIHALAEVANMAGEDSRNWFDEANMIETIANDVSSKLIITPSSDFGDFVGIEAHLEAMSSILCLEAEESRMVAILGPSGIGKSTIGRALFSKLSNQFHHRAFVAYKRTNRDDYGMKLCWEEQFLSEILCQKDVKLFHLGAVEQRLKHKKVLIVLDDVDDLELLKTLVGQTGWFGLGSRIIVITKDKQLLKSHQIDLIYEVDFPSESLALQMFCRCTFGQNSPPVGFMKLAGEVANLAGNLPLGLNVLGSSLRGKDKEEWMELLPRLRNGLDGKIEKTLRVSYDELDCKDQEVFLYIACLLNSQKIDYIKNLLGDSVGIGLRILADKSLIRITPPPRKTVHMHNLLQMLGKEIVRAESIYNPGKRRFLVDTKDICDVFAENTGTENVLGMYFNTSEIDEPLFINEQSFKGMRNLTFLKVYKEWSRETSEGRLYLPQGFVYLPRKIRLLYWDEYPLKCMHFNFRAEILVKLTMENSKLEKLWEGVQPLRSLKKIRLDGSTKLKEIPNLSNAINLEKVNLWGCTSLVTLPSSIRNLNKLRKLSMEGCTKLEVLPTDINLGCLDYLNLSGCSRLRRFPRISRNISGLILDGTAIDEEDSFYLANISGLTKLDWNGCPMRCMPPNFRSENLVYLTLRGCKLEKLWEEIRPLRNLVRMDLSGCENLKEFPNLSKATNLDSLELNDCKSIVMLPSSIQNLNKLTRLEMRGCTKLKVLPIDVNLESLEYLDLRGCSRLRSFPRISRNISELHLDGTAIEEDQDARKLILQSDFKYAVLPGGEVPTYFRHRARGASLTVPLPKSSLSLKVLRFKACIMLQPPTHYTKDCYAEIWARWYFRGKSNIHHVNIDVDSCNVDHLVVFHVEFCPSKEVDCQPYELHNNNVEFKFVYHSSTCSCHMLFPDFYKQTCPFSFRRIKGCGVRLLNVSPSKDGSGTISQTEYNQKSGESDIESGRSKKRMRMTVRTSEEPSNVLCGKTVANTRLTAPNLELSLGQGEASAQMSSRSMIPSSSVSLSNFHGDGTSLHLSLSPSEACLGGEALYFDPMITEQQDTETPIVGRSLSPQLINYLR